MEPTKLSRAIDTGVPDIRGWHSKDTRITYQLMGEKLVKKGFSIEEAVDILFELYHTITRDMDG